MITADICFHAVKFLNRNVLTADVVLTRQNAPIVVSVYSFQPPVPTGQLRAASSHLHRTIAFERSLSINRM